MILIWSEKNPDFDFEVKNADDMEQLIYQQLHSQIYGSFRLIQFSLILVENNMKNTLLEPTYIFDDKYQLTQTINLAGNYEQIPKEITENNQDFPERIGRFFPLNYNLEPW